MPQLASVAQAPPAEASPAPPSGGYPFRGPGLLGRAAPFAVVAVLAEASLALPPRAASAWAVLASVVLLIAAAAAFLLPWARLPGWMMVGVPLTYCGSALALILAAGGARSGLSMVLLIPLTWTALFHRRWESACVVAAAVAVMVIVSLIPAAAPGAVTARRVLLWASLGALISVSAHGLRDRIQLSRDKSARLQGRLRELTLMQDRDRIDDALRDKAIQRLFATGLNLQNIAAHIKEPGACRRVEASIHELDQAILEVRGSAFDLNQRLHGRRLHAEILGLCRELSLAPELSLSGPVEGALHPGSRARLLAVLRDALGLIGQQFAPGRIGITAGEGSILTVIDAVPLTRAAEGSQSVHQFLRLREKALQAGIGLHIEPGPDDGTRFTWHVPLTPPATEQHHEHQTKPPDIP